MYCHIACPRYPYIRVYGLYDTTNMRVCPESVSVPILPPLPYVIHGCKRGDIKTHPKRFSPYLATRINALLVLFPLLF